MAERDLVGALKVAIERADPSWVTQPSHLRRRLDEELGQDARTYRAQVHQLIVAAEERVPIRLQRNGWSPTEKTELVSLLVGTRGWTVIASDWAVSTWAAALDLTDGRPVAAQIVIPPRETSVDVAMPDRTDRAPSDAPVEPTVLPSEMDAAASSELPSGIGGPVVNLQSDTNDASWEPVEEAPSSSDPSLENSGFGENPAAELPRRGVRGCTKKTAKFLGHELDVAYEVFSGPSPVWLLLALPVGLGAFAFPLLSGIFLMAFLLIIVLGRALWPKRILAVMGNQVWVLRASGYTANPKEVVAETTRDQIEFAGGRPFPSVRIDGQRLWFLFPATGAARRLPTQTVRDGS